MAEYDHDQLRQANQRLFNTDSARSDGRVSVNGQPYDCFTVGDWKVVVRVKETRTPDLIWWLVGIVVVGMWILLNRDQGDVVLDREGVLIILGIVALGLGWGIRERMRPREWIDYYDTVLPRLTERIPAGERFIGTLKPMIFRQWRRGVPVDQAVATVLTAWSTMLEHTMNEPVPDELALVFDSMRDDVYVRHVRPTVTETTKDPESASR